MKYKFVLISFLFIFSFCKKEVNQVTDANFLAFVDGSYSVIPLDKVATPQIGWNEFFKFTIGNIKYPTEARENNIQGIVNSYIIINENGKIEDFGIEKGIGYGCDEEVLRVIGLFKDEIFNPATKDGKPIKVKYLYKVSFKLE